MTMEKKASDALDGLKEMVVVLLDEMCHLSNMDERVQEILAGEELPGHINEAGRFAMTTMGEIVSGRINVALGKFQAIANRITDG